MTQIFKTVLSMSLAGAVLTTVLLFAIRLLKGRLGRQWQYYIWLIVLARFLLPFGPETSLLGRTYQTADRMLSQGMQITQGMQSGVQDSVKDPVQDAGVNTELDTEQSYGQNTEVSSGRGAAQEGPDAAGESVTENEKMTADGLQRVAAETDNKEMRLKREPVFLTAAVFAGKYLWVVWLAVAFGMLIRKVSMYQSYVRFVAAGAARVSDTALLDRLAVTAWNLGIGRPIELCVNPLAASPMLVGYFQPCIILPDADAAEKDFDYIVMHELIHYKRRDIWYKWLVQFTVCLHWFNPFVCAMSREIDRACEFSCDEAVVRKMGYDHAKGYGKTLLDAMAAGAAFREPPAAVTMSADKELLRERLGAIMSCKKRTKTAGIIAAGLTVCVALAAVFIGVYPAAAAESGQSGVADAAAAGSDGAGATGAAVRTGESDTAVLSQAGNMNAEGADQEETGNASEKNRADAEKYYKARSLPLFYIAFCGLSEKEQENWMERLYADGEMQFFSVGLMRMDADNPLIQSFAEQFYADDDIAFFSQMTNLMDTETLEGWLDRALADQKWNFQSMLYDKLDRVDEKDELDRAMEEEQRKAYQAVGVTWNGKNCYYKGQLVHIFLDMHKPDRSFYTLDMNPAGTVDIKIVRTEEGQIDGVAYLTEAEVTELFGDMEEDIDAADETETDAEADAEFPRLMTVIMPACNIRAGAGEAHKVVGMIGEGDMVVVLGEQNGDDGQMWYLLDRESLPEPPDASVKACYIRADLLEGD